MKEMDAGVRRFLQKSMTARIATISPGGRPQIMPLWFVLHDGDILMNNAETSPTVRNITYSPDVEVLFLADRSGEDGRCLRLRGTAEFVKDRALLRRIALQGIVKYYASPGAIACGLRHLGRLPSMVRYRRERRAGGVIRVTPMSWEFIEVPQGASEI